MTDTPMTCKRCGCTTEAPCPGGCAWSLPDVCSRCLTPDETRLEAQYASLLANLRAVLEQNRNERFLLAVAQGLLANPGTKLDAFQVEAFVGRAFEIAIGLVDAADEVDDEGDDRRDSGLVLP
jgi:hypothetical protein